ncbi:MAG TPA: hypothetical protein VJV79_37675 [Polyangiaceae bacterium]|nr:hypothetical protein [Polyangiaceae bacterium]
MNATFAVYLNATVVDAAGNIVRVGVAAAVTNSPAVLPPGAPADKLTTVFQGVRADDVLAHRLTDALLFSLDEVQEQCAQSRVADVVSWLSIPGNT